MKLDSLFTGAPITRVTPRMEYADGQPTGVQDSADGVPLWNVEVAVRDDVFVLPLRIRVAHATEPRPDTTVTFYGVEARAFNGRIYYSADGFALAQDDRLDEILQEGTA